MSGRLYTASVIQVLLLVARASWGQGVSRSHFDVRYDELEASTIRWFAETRATIAAASEPLRRLQQVSVRAPSIDSANASTAVDIAQAALRTDVAGAKAGVSVSPLGLLGFAASPFQIVLTMASLDDGSTRFQEGLSWQASADPVIALPSCEPPRIEEMEKSRAWFRATCSELESRSTRAPDGMDSKEWLRLVAQAFAQCGLPSTERQFPRLGTTLLLLQAQAKKLNISGGDQPLAYQEPFIDCATSSTIDDEIVRSSWATPRLRVGITLRADLFPRVLGFHADPLEPRDLRRNDSEVRVETSYGRTQLELTVGLGYGAGRRSVKDSLVTYYAPSLAIAWTVGSLSGDPLFRDGKLNIVKGTLPPRLVVGLDAQLQYTQAPPAGQVVNIQKVAVTGYADFRFSEKLTVRIGVPVSAKLAARSDPLKLDRQWTIPAFVAAIVKL